MGRIGPGRWIRNHLLEVGEDYIGSMFQGYKKTLQEREYHVPSYLSFYKIVWCLRRLGLIHETRREDPEPPARYPRVYYAIVPGQEKSSTWSTPQGSLYPKTKLGSARYQVP